MASGSWLAVTICVWLLALMLAVMAAEEEQQREGCPATRCGDLNISHPFWLTDLESGRSCGPPGFEVTCYRNNTSVLRSSVPAGFGFAIVNISYEEDTLVVVDLGKLEEGRCTDLTLMVNTSVKLGAPFKVSPAADLLILYNCTEAAAAAARRDPALAEMRCGMNESNAFARARGPYNSSENYERYHLEGCTLTCLPVRGTSGEEAKASDYEQLIKDGFVLTWDLPPPNPPLTRNQRTGKKILLIVLASAAAALLFPCIYMLIRHRRWKGL